MVDENKTKVAVYGTLMDGESNHRWMGGCRKAADGTMRGRLVDTGWGYPMADIGGPGRIAVEVYAASPEDIARMDVLEGCPNLYTRTTVAVETRDGTIDAVVYVPANRKRVQGMREIAPGTDGVADWRRDR